MSNHGIHPPLTARTKKHEARWYKQGTEDSSVNPETYTRYDDSLPKLFQDVLPLLNPESAILDLGCNAGRSLNYLYQKGFHNLTGIEIGPHAVDLFAQQFSDTYKNSTIICGNAVDEISKIKTDSVDLVFAHSVLVNISSKHNHIFREMCRICRGYILSLENDGSWKAFPRDFQHMFKQEGFIMVSYRWMVWDKDRTFLTFPRFLSDQYFFKNNTIRLFVSKDKNNIGN